MRKYDVVIVGSGPAGMFAALELVERAPGAKIAIFEKGADREIGGNCSVTSGWGGAGAFSDGKLDLTSAVGGTVHEVIGREAFDGLVPYIDGKYLSFGGSPDRLFDASQDPDRWARVMSVKARALGVGLDLIPFPIRHLGTDTAHAIVGNIRRHLTEKGVAIYLDSAVGRINRDPSGGLDLEVEGAFTGHVHGDFVLAAPGRSGAEWMAEQSKRLGLRLHNNGVDVGVRIEVKNETLAALAGLLYEAKIVYHTRRSDDKLRTFCMCPGGYVAMENYHGLKTVNGHSFSERKSPNTNFAVLMTQVFTEPFNDPLGYGNYVSGLANKLAGGGVLVQRLGDLKNGRRSKAEKMADWTVQPTLRPPSAMPGDLSLAMPHRQLKGVVEMLEALNHVAPGIASPHTLLYGIEVKFYSFRIETREGFETEVPGLYVAGDGSGYTRGLLQSSMQGVIVARHIAARLPAPATQAP